MTFRTLQQIVTAVVKGRKSVYRKQRKTRKTKRIGLRSVLRPHQHSIGYMGDGFYRSKDPTNSIKVLKEKAVKENNTKTQITHMHAHTK